MYFMNGMKVISSLGLTETKIMIKRDRRFVKQPRLVKRKKISPVRTRTVPSMKAFVSEQDNTIFMHPAMIEKMKGEFDKQGFLVDRMGFKHPMPGLAGSFLGS